VARAKDRRPTWVRDLPIGDRPVVISWWKRSTKAAGPLWAALIAADRTGEPTLAWTAAQDLMALYQLTDPTTAREKASKLIADLRECPIPELARLGRTLHSWRTELLARFDHPTVSNGPTENPPSERPIEDSATSTTTGCDSC
jgi:hypothetical protein